MALDIPSTQIYAGRYHSKNIEVPNLFDETRYTCTTEKKLLREEIPIDTVTFSDEGLGIDALNKAYHTRAENAAAGARAIAEVNKYFNGANYSTEFLDELENKVKESWQSAISEKNMERLRQKVNSVKDYTIDFGISAAWMDTINALLFKGR